MCFSSIRTNNQHCIDFSNTFNIIAHCSRAQDCDQTGHRGAVSVTGTMINIVGAYPLAEKFLKYIILFSGASC